MATEQNGGSDVVPLNAGRYPPRSRNAFCSHGACDSSAHRLFLRLGPVVMALAGCVVLVVGLVHAKDKLQSQLAASGICIFFAGVLLFVFVNCCNCCSSTCRVLCSPTIEQAERAIEDDYSAGTSSSRELRERNRSQQTAQLLGDNTTSKSDGDTTATSESHDEKSGEKLEHSIVWNLFRAGLLIVNKTGQLFKREAPKIVNTRVAERSNM